MFWFFTLLNFCSSFPVFEHRLIVYKEDWRYHIVSEFRFTTVVTREDMSQILTEDDINSFNNIGLGLLKHDNNINSTITLTDHTSYCRFYYTIPFYNTMRLLLEPMSSMCKQYIVVLLNIEREGMNPCNNTEYIDALRAMNERLFNGETNSISCLMHSHSSTQ